MLGEPKKALALGKAQGLSCQNISGWKRCRKSIAKPPRCCARPLHSLLLLRFKFPALCSQKRNESRFICLLLKCSLLSSFSNLFQPTPKLKGSTSLLERHKRKTWMSYSLSVCSPRFSTTLTITGQVSNIHEGEYSAPVKCALEDNKYPRSTLRTCKILHSVALSICIALDCNSEVLISNYQKQASSHAFIKCRAPPNGQTPLATACALVGRCKCKITKSLVKKSKVK